ncbi:hypothetical protein FI667_g10295, partial [Globisporangium splendens]
MVPIQTQTYQHYDHPHLAPGAAYAYPIAGCSQKFCDDADLVVTDVESPCTTEPPMLLADMMTDIKSIASTIESVKTKVRARRQSQRRGAALRSPDRRRSLKAQHASSPVGKDSNQMSREREKRERGRRKKDGDTLDYIYAGLQESVGMCRYWGKKCWNLRVPKEKGGFHSLCHFHRVKANENQRRFDYKRRGTLWRCFQADPNYKDVSLFPGTLEPSDANSEIQSGSFEPFESAVPLKDEDVDLLRELVGAATV